MLGFFIRLWLTRIYIITFFSCLRFWRGFTIVIDSSSLFTLLSLPSSLFDFLCNWFECILPTSYCFLIWLWNCKNGSNKLIRIYTLSSSSESLLLWLTSSSESLISLPLSAYAPKPAIKLGLRIFNLQHNIDKGNIRDNEKAEFVQWCCKENMNIGMRIFFVFQLKVEALKWLSL